MPLRTDLFKLAFLFAVAGAACLWAVFGTGCQSAGGTYTAVVYNVNANIRQIS